MHGTRKRRPLGAIKHFLLTVALDPHTRMHAYLACADKHRAFDEAEWLVREAEKVGSTYPLRHTVLVTPLDDGGETVRRIASARSEEVRLALRTVTDFQLATWATSTDDAGDRVLMELH